MQQPQITHHIQLDIIRRMVHLPEARYSDLKSKAIESNLFMYHLKQLIREGLIEKQGKAYVLTQGGKSFADRATLETMKIHLQPKVVIVLCVRRPDGHWLVMRRKYQPFIDYKGFPSGKLQFGEPLQAAADRVLLEKTGLRDIELRLRAHVVIRFTEGGQIVNHLIEYVFDGEVSAGTQVEYSTDDFQTFFGPASLHYEEPCFKGHREIFELLETPSSGVQVREFEFASDY